MYISVVEIARIRQVHDIHDIPEQKTAIFKKFNICNAFEVINICRLHVMRFKRIFQLGGGKLPVHRVDVVFPKHLFFCNVDLIAILHLQKDRRRQKEKTRDNVHRCLSIAAARFRLQHIGTSPCNIKSVQSFERWSGFLIKIQGCTILTEQVKSTGALGVTIPRLIAP